MSSGSSHPRAAYFEEYNEDAHTTLPETRQTANIAAKRSKPDIAKLKHAQGGRDEASDSGYSSHAIVTGGSEDPSEPKSQIPLPLRINTDSAAVPAKVTGKKDKTAGTPKSPQKPTLRRTETKAGHGEVVRQKNCNCNECQSKSRRSAAPLPTLRPVELRPARSQPEAAVPPSPSKSMAAPPVREFPVIQPAQVRPRAATAQPYRPARPISYHSGAMSEYPYTQPMYIERRPLPTFPTGLSYPPPSYPPPRPSYFPPPLQAMPPCHEASAIPPFSYEPLPHLVPRPPARPPPRQWASEQQPPSRPPITYGTSSVVEYPVQPGYPIINAPPQPNPRRSFNLRERPAPLPEEPFFYDEDYERMQPPPRLKGGSQQYRPAVGHSATTSAAHPTLHHPLNRRGEEGLGGMQGKRSPRKASPEKSELPFRPSLASRSSAASNNEKSNLHSSDRSSARIRAEGNTAAKQKRRASYYGHETPHDLERVVEAYQAMTNADAGTPHPDLTADSLKLVRKKTQTSDAGSRGSGEGRGSREGSEVKPRSSIGRHAGSDVKTRGDNDGFTMRFPQGVNVDLKGGAVDGRTISLRQSGEAEGSLELSIGARGRNSSSRNEVRDKSRKRHSYIDGSGLKEMDYARSASRATRGDKEIATSRDKEIRVAGSRIRRSSRSVYRDGVRMI